MDDDALAKPCVLFSGRCDHGKHAKCSKLLKLDNLSARRLIAKQHINNKHLCSGMMPKKHRKPGTVEHSLIMVPIYKFFTRVTGQL